MGSKAASASRWARQRAESLQRRGYGRRYIRSEMLRKGLGRALAEEILKECCRDADQLAFLIDLKSLSDMGYAAPEKWAGHVKERLQTPAGIEMADCIGKTEWDSWWLKLFIDSGTKEK